MRTPLWCSFSLFCVFSQTVSAHRSERAAFLRVVSIQGDKFGISRWRVVAPPQNEALESKSTLGAIFWLTVNLGPRYSLQIVVSLFPLKACRSFEGCFYFWTCGCHGSTILFFLPSLLIPGQDTSCSSPRREEFCPRHTLPSTPFPPLLNPASIF